VIPWVPLAAHLCEVLTERADHRALRERFELELQDHLSREDAEHTLRVVTDFVLSPIRKTT